MHTNDPKTSTVILRMNDEMRGWVEGEAKKRGIGISEYVRQVLKEVCEHPAEFQTNPTLEQLSVADRACVDPLLIEDICKTIELQGESAEAFLRVLNEKLNDYEITFENGEIWVDQQTK